MKCIRIVNIFKTVLVFSAAVSVLLNTACGGGGGGGTAGGGSGGVSYTPVNNSYAMTFESGSTTDISRFNVNNVYILLTYLPAAKYESDSAPTGRESDWDIDTTALSIASLPLIFSDNRESYIYGKNGTMQSDLDLKVRESERVILASGEPQFSVNKSVRYAAAPSIINLDTVWNNIKIVATGNTISATCKKISTRAYLFVDNRDIGDTDVSDANLTAYATAFDSIYAMNRSKFGNEHDVDGNGKILIVFSRELTGGMLGYFYSGDKYSSSSVADSNEGDIFYMTTDTYGEDTICGTLAHEFQHMIYFDEHVNRGSTTTFAWLNEALSQAAEYYNGYLTNHNNWIRSFLNNGWSELSLTHWTDDNYGYSAIFIRYLIDQYGDSAIKQMCSTDKSGIAAVEAATGEDFNEIFYNFTIALVVSQKITSGNTDYNSKYSFTSLNLDTLQSAGRKGLISSQNFTAGTVGSSWNYPYEILFLNGINDFSTISISGTDMMGTAFGLTD
jgi:hypothetical protein